VTHPGKFDLRGGLTLSAAVAMAGGFSPNAKQDQVLLFRRVAAGTVEVKKVNVKAMFAKGGLAEDVTLQPGDLIYASKSVVGKIDRFLAVSRLGFWFPLSFR
jgi:protein involved in polysaccharide export with SLBB domain